MRVTTAKSATVLRQMAWFLALLLSLLNAVAAERLPIKTYTTADGLAHNRVYQIVRDSRGFLWFCTAEGLSRFDGYRFTNYTVVEGLPSPSVRDLLETRAGIYWVAIGDGLVLFNPASDPLQSPDFANRVPNPTRNPQSAIHNSTMPMFITYHPGEDKVREVNVLLEDHTGTIWCGTNDGLFRLEQAGDQVKFHLIEMGMPNETGDDRLVEALLEDRRGALWVGTHGSGLYRLFPDGRSERYTTQQGLPDEAVHTLLEDKDGSLWVGTGLGLGHIVPESNSHRVIVTRIYTTRDGLPSNWIDSLFQASGDRLWIGTSLGLSELIPGSNKTGREFRAYTTAQGLTTGAIEAMAEDRGGNLWIATEGSGAMRMARNGFTTYRETNGLGKNGVGSIFEGQTGELYVDNGSPGEFRRFDGNRFHLIRPRFPKHITFFGWGWNQIMFQDHLGEWWLQTGQGLCRFPKVSHAEQLANTPPRAVYTSRDGLIADNVFRLFEDSHGDVWISSISSGPSGLSRWERLTESIHSYSERDGLPATFWATAFAEDASGSIWVGTGGSGLARLTAGRSTLFKASDGLPGGAIRALYVDHAGRLWIATSQGGLSRIDDPKADHPRFVTYTTAEDLSSNDVWCVTEDRWNRIYIGTGRGVDRIDPSTGHVRHYTGADGLAGGEVQVAFRDRHGELWFGTVQGLSRIVPQPDDPQSPPPILISSLRIAGVTHRLSTLGEAEVSKLVLRPNQDDIQIDYVGLAASPGEALRYQYKLEGADQNWSELSDQRQVNYANLAPGTYRFLVRAVTPDGTASRSPASVAFKIFPPFWRRWWFLTLAAILAGAVIYGLDRYRIARLIELERVRMRIATDLHDDIGSSLSQIAILSEVVRQQVDGTNLPVTKPLSSIATSSREMVDSMSDIVWAINPKKDHLHDLTQRMRRFAGDTLTARNIDFRFRAPGAEQDIRLGTDVRRQVFLIFKETLNNMARHSQCTEADIDFHIEKDLMTLRLRDNGKGFDPAQASDGHGLMSMRERARELGGRLEMASGNGGGTTITLTAPLARPRVLRWKKSLPE